MMAHWYTGPNADLVAEARAYIGVRWKHQGRSAEGVDCIGLPIMVARKLRGFEFDVTDYPRASVDDTMLRICAEHCARVSLKDMQPGDIVVVGFERQHHMAMIGDYPIEPHLSMIHAHLKNRQVEEHRLDSVWRSRIRGVFRFEGSAQCRS